MTQKLTKQRAEIRQKRQAAALKANMKRRKEAGKKVEEVEASEKSEN